MSKSIILPGTTPEAVGGVAYKRLSDVPAEELASRLVTALIMQEGNLNKYDAVLRRFIENTRAEATEDRAALLEACRYIVDAGEDGDEVTAIEKATAAIAKALGPSAQDTAEPQATPGKPNETNTTDQKETG